LPKLSQIDDSADYEAELAVVLGPRPVKNVPAAEALDYVLGYTAANDVSSRTAQFATSQWCFSKGFDGSCPLGPVLVSPDVIPDSSKLRLKGLLNGEVMQDCGTDDLIFSIPQLIEYLSQDTTLPPGTVILTGTPAGVGIARAPRRSLVAGDEFRVQIQPHIGTLVNVFET
jgi:2-keto-4-pentenoate hydratase/2-oxohepta-3-ene-1,7-dioic acid hydratase in catechol pathway